jgi:hypothetical protein
LLQALIPLIRETRQSNQNLISSNSQSFICCYVRKQQKRAKDKEGFSLLCLYMWSTEEDPRCQINAITGIEKNMDFL